MELLTKISDDRFDLEKLDQYELHIEIQTSRFKFYIKNNNSQTIFWLEDYIIKREYTPLVYVDKIIKLIEDHTFLKASFWNRIHIIFDTPIHLKVKEVFFDEARSFDYLKIQFPEIDTELYTIKTEKIDSDYLLYAFPIKLLDFLKKVYALKEPFIENRLSKICKSFKSNIKSNDYNWIILGEKWFEIFYKNGPSDIVHFKKLPNNSTNLQDGLDILIKSGGMKTLAWGEITTYSKVYIKIKSKIKSTEIGKSFSNKKFTREFEELPPQRHFSLFL